MVKKIYAIICILLLAGAVIAQRLSVQAPKVVSQGENFRITFTSDGDIDDFNPPKITGFTVLAGPSKSTSSNMSIINGKTSSNTTVSYTYILQAKQVGSFTIPSAHARTDRGNIASNPFEIEVVENNAGHGSAQKQKRNDDDAIDVGNDMFVLVEPSKRSVYLGEPITVSIKLYTQVNSAIAGFENIKFPAFTGFWSQDYQTPQNINLQREKFRGKVYDVGLMRSYILFPQQTGDLSIDPFSMDLILQVRKRSRDIFDDFFGGSVQNIRKALSSGKTIIKVKPLPSGAPASFKGAVGSFQMSATASRESVMANSGFSINVKISGTGNLKLLECPHIQLPPDFESYEPKVADNFRNSPQGSVGTKQFEVPVIARSAGDFSISPVQFSYFDPQKGKYIELSSAAMSIKVAKDPNGGSGSMMSGAMGKEELKMLGKDIRHINLDKPGLKDRYSIFFGSIFYYLLVLLILGAIVFAYRYLKKRYAFLSDTVRVKNKKANKVALMRLKKSRALLDENKEAFFEELLQALNGYLSDKLDISKADYSRINAQSAMENAGVEKEAVDLFLHVMDECEFARYAPSASQANRKELYESAQKLIMSFEQTIKS